MIDVAQCESPLGRLILAGDGEGLRHLDFAGPEAREPSAGWRENPAAHDEARRQLDEYFAGRRQRFDLRLAPRGTPFQRAVWQALLALPFGRTESYAALAARLGRPGAARSMGAAVAANPLAIVVPCHRVVGSGGGLTGYRWGLARKEALLRLEGWAGR